jgi:hypothetical protein
MSDFKKPADSSNARTRTKQGRRKRRTRPPCATPIYFGCLYIRDFTEEGLASADRDLKRVCADWPTLTPRGFGCRYERPAYIPEPLKFAQITSGTLRDPVCLRAFMKTREWIALNTTPATITYDLTSLEWAFIAAQDGLATANGVFIAAAAAERRLIERVGNTSFAAWDAWLGLDLKDPKKFAPLFAVMTGDAEDAI